MRAEIDQCAYGLMSKDKEGVGPAKKPTSFLTNSVGLVNALSKKCGGCSRHVQLVEGRARAAQEYPRELCRAVTRGIVEQARMDAQDVFSVECSEYVDGMSGIYNIEHDENEMDGRCFWDDTSGEVLDSDLTRAARAEEVEAIRSVPEGTNRSVRSRNGQETHRDALGRYQQRGCHQP